MSGLGLISDSISGPTGPAHANKFTASSFLSGQHAPNFENRSTAFSVFSIHDNKHTPRVPAHARPQWDIITLNFRATHTRPAGSGALPLVAPSEFGDIYKACESGNYKTRDIMQSR